MRLAFVTDLHIGDENEKPFDIDVRLHFQCILFSITQRKPEHIILGGDLCLQSADEDVYLYIKSHLDASGIPYTILSGNHDTSAAIAGAFQLPLWNTQLVKRTRMGGVELFFLDSSTAKIPENQLQWLHTELLECTSPVFVFVHHPPLLANVPYMDTAWPLENGSALENILLDFGKPVFVFAGHYHIEKTTVRKNITQLITPSCFVQIDQYANDFKADHNIPAWRMIEWKENTLQTTVHYAMPQQSNAGKW